MRDAGDQRCHEPLTCFSEVSLHTPLLPADGAAHPCLKSHDESIEVEHSAEWQAL